MSKRLLVVAAIAVFAFSVPAAAQTNDEASQQRPSESVPVCVPTTTGTQETTAPVRTLTVYNPVTAASTPSLTFYNPVAYPRPALTYYTPLGQIDPPFRTPPPLPPPVETVQSAGPTLSQPSMPATQTIPAPGVCPPGTQVERVAR